MERGRRLGMDPGEVRTGVAVSDPDGLLATPVATLAGEVLTDIAALVAEYDASVIYVGLPRSLSGGEGPAAVRVRDLAHRLAGTVEVEVRLVDERLTTVIAEAQVRHHGKRRRKVVDQAAAVIILQAALDAERATGARAGELVERNACDGPQ